MTPNGDGKNDAFAPVLTPGCEVNNYNLVVYNRFGQRIYNSANAAQAWEGNYNGIPADVGTYFYELRFDRGKRGKQYYSKGDVTLIR